MRARRGRRRAGDRLRASSPRRAPSSSAWGTDGRALRRSRRASSSTASTARSRSRRCGSSRQGGARVEAIDGAIRGAGYPIGPFELMDLTGIDVTYAAATAIWEGLGAAATGSGRRRSRSELVAAGRLGRKTGEGFYRYATAAVGPASVAARSPRSARRSRPSPTRAIRDRILGAIVNEAARALDEGVASAARHRSRAPAGRQPSGRARSSEPPRPACRRRSLGDPASRRRRGPRRAPARPCRRRATIGRMTRDLHRPLREAWVVEAVRTPIGRYGGALARRPPGRPRRRRDPGRRRARPASTRP